MLAKQDALQNIKNMIMINTEILFTDYDLDKSCQWRRYYTLPFA